MQVQIRIVSVGPTGESATLSIEENRKVIEKTVELAKGRFQSLLEPVLMQQVSH